MHAREMANSRLEHMMFAYWIHVRKSRAEFSGKPSPQSLLNVLWGGYDSEAP